MVTALWWWSTPLLTDHSWPWSTMVIYRLVGYQMTIIWPWSLHALIVVNATTDWPCLTMVDHGQLIMVNSWSMIVELALDHGRPWSFRGLSTMKGPSFDHGHYIVDDGHGTADWPWSTMVDHGQYIGFDYHWPSDDHDYWPWSTMVMTIVPFNKHGRPWSDHGQLMVIS